MARKTDREREMEAQRLGLFKVYVRTYCPTEKRYGNKLRFYRGYKTYEEAMRVVNSDPRRFFM